MTCCAEGGDEDEERRGSNVCPAKERILAAYPRYSGNDKGLCAPIRQDGEVWNDREWTLPKKKKDRILETHLSQ